MAAYGALAPPLNVPARSADRPIADPPPGIGGGSPCPIADMLRGAIGKYARRLAPQIHLQHVAPRFVLPSRTSVTIRSQRTIRGITRPMEVSTDDRQRCGLGRLPCEGAPR